MGRRVIIIAALLGGIALALLMHGRGSTPGPTRAAEQPTPRSRSVGVELGDGHQSTRRGGERRAPSSSLGTLAGDDWDEVPGDRVGRAERAVAATLADARADDIDARANAGLILSAARADFSASEAGVSRYVALTQALEAADEAPAED